MPRDTNPTSTRGGGPPGAAFHVRPAQFSDHRGVSLLADEEQAVSDALAPTFRPHFLVSINTGLRYRERLDLRWANIDALTGLITVRRTKNGHARQIPMNSLVRSTLMDLAAKRKHPNDPLSTYSIRGRSRARASSTRPW